MSFFRKRRISFKAAAAASTNRRAKISDSGEKFVDSFKTDLLEKTYVMIYMFNYTIKAEKSQLDKQE